MGSLAKKHVINIYCDESVHLTGQGDYMVIGSVWGAKLHTEALKDKVSLIKAKHEISKLREIKWTKVSKAKAKYYRDLVDLFFAEEGLNFRAIVIPTANLRHEEFRQTKDDFYYKMQYTMLKTVVRRVARKHNTDFKIYLDFKDTWSNVRSERLSDYLLKALEHEEPTECTISAQPIRSYESVPLQLTDLLIGAVAHANNYQDEAVSSAKAQLIQHIQSRSGQKLTQQTPYGVDKFNILVMHLS